MTDNSIIAANTQLNQMLNDGLCMQAFEQFYAPNVVMQENSTEPRMGKDQNREACQGFVDAAPDLKLTVKSVAYNDDSSFQEVDFSYTDEEGNPIAYTEVAVRKWHNGLVVEERFYYG